jgi:hypothetical protein
MSDAESQSAGKVEFDDATKPSWPMGKDGVALPRLSDGVKNAPKESNPRPGKRIVALRAKPDYYRKALYGILTKSEGQADAMIRLRRVARKIEEAQAEQIGRPLTASEKRKLRMRTYRDAHSALAALAVDIVSEGNASSTQLRRAGNINYLRWGLEKEILSLHWKIPLAEVETRQKQSGLRMPSFLSESLQFEKLI